MCRPEARPSIAINAAGDVRAMSPTVVIPRSCSFAAVTAPTPHTRSIGSGWRKASSSSGGTTRSPSGLATPLATLARNLVLATPTEIRRPTCSRTSRRSCTAISVGVPAIRHKPLTSRNASSIDRPSTQRRRLLEDPEHGPTRFGVGSHPRLDDDGVRTQPPGLRAAHRRAHPARLGLVAGGEHDTHPDDDRAAAQPSVVTLLDGRVEGIEIGVQDGRRVRHEHMFAQTRRPSVPVYASGAARTTAGHRSTGCRRAVPPERSGLCQRRAAVAGHQERARTVEHVARRGGGRCPGRRAARRADRPAGSLPDSGAVGSQWAVAWPSGSCCRASRSPRDGAPLPLPSSSTAPSTR